MRRGTWLGVSFEHAHGDCDDVIVKNVTTHVIRLKVFNNFRKDGRIFIKFGMNIIPLEKILIKYFLISYNTNVVDAQNCEMDTWGH